MINGQRRSKIMPKGIGYGKKAVAKYGKKKVEEMKKKKAKKAKK